MGLPGGGSAIAQTVTSDNTTGTQVTVFDDVFTITGGQLEETNLFHSFETFSPQTSEAIFDLSDSSYSNVSNIFSRVTGDTATNINGVLEVKGGNLPGLFLLNPNGIVVGPDADFYVASALVLSTADSLLFSDGTTFSASRAQPAPMLTVSAPVGLQMGTAAAPIEVNGRLGSFNPNTDDIDYDEVVSFDPFVSLTLLGGDVALNSVGIDTPSGQLQIGSVEAGTQVGIDTATHQLVDYLPETAFKEIDITNSFINASSLSDSTNLSSSGRMSLKGKRINLQFSELYADNEGSGNGGLIELSASENIHVENSRIRTVLRPTESVLPDGSPLSTPSIGNGGSIAISADELVVLPGTLIDADTISSGNGGSIGIKANKVSLIGDLDPVRGSSPSIWLSSSALAAGNGGSVTVDADSLEMSGSVFISAISRPNAGSSGMTGIQSGRGGDITFNTGSLVIKDGVQVSTGSYSDAAAGDLTIRASDIVISEQLSPTLENSFYAVDLNTNAYAEGDGGHLFIAADSLSVKGAADIQSSSLPYAGSGLQYGDGGDVFLDVGRLSLEGGAVVSTATVTDGNAGNLTIYADDISVGSPSDLQSTSILTGTYGAGDGGVLTVNAKTLRAYNSANLIATTSSDPRLSGAIAQSSGNGGSILVDVESLALKEGAQIVAGTFSNGDSGDLTVRATKHVDISGTRLEDPASPSSRLFSSGLFISSEPGSSGNGGNLLLSSPSLRVTEGGSISARTAGSGNAGDIRIEAGEIVVADAVVHPLGDTLSGIVATVFPSGSGDGGQIDITSGRLHLSKGGRIAASTNGAGNAGNINIQSRIVDVEGTSTESLFDSGISSRSTTSFDAGSVTVDAKQINLRDRGTISVSSLSGGNAGDVSLSADMVYLNDSSVRAEASAGDRGNLNIESRELLLRQNSQITTNATETASGGNINISASLILGAENSDISANAIEGNGGSIRLITQGLVGLEFREALTSKSDITASSELGASGTVEIESPNADTDNGLVQLPENLEDKSNQIVAGCTANDENLFVSSGRGGLPISPLTNLSGDRPWLDLGAVADGQSPEKVANTLNTGTVFEDAVFEAETELVEAIAWQRSASGEIEFLAADNFPSTSSYCLEQKRVAVDR